MASIGASPENYGLKVRTHPDGMIVTALNKMRNSDTRKVTYSGHLVQITKYYRKSDVNQRNVDFLSTWAASLGKPGMNGRGAPGSYIWKMFHLPELWIFGEYQGSPRMLLCLFPYTDPVYIEPKRRKRTDGLDGCTDFSEGSKQLSAQPYDWRASG